VLLVGTVVVQPLIALHGDMREELTLLNAQRVRFARLEAELPQLRGLVSELRAQKPASDASLLLTDSSDAVASAALQTKIKSLGGSLGAEISSVESLVPQRREGGFRRVGVRVAIKGDLTALTGILSALATARPPLFVDNLEIRNGGFTGQQTNDPAPVMSVGMEVYGYRTDSGQSADFRG